MKTNHVLTCVLVCGLALLLFALGLRPSAPAASSLKGYDDIGAASTHAPFGLDLVGQIGGPSYAVALQGDLLYFGVGPRLVIWDVTDPAAPIQVGQTDVLRDVVVGIDVVGPYAYLACEQGGLRVIDVGLPAAPREVGDYQIAGLPTEAYKLDIVGNHAYVTDRLRGLRVVDISNPAQPAEVGFYDTPGFAVDVVVLGSYAYVADEAYRLEIVNVSVPSNPTPVTFDSYYPTASVWAVAADTGYLYVATGEGLDILSLADPTAPVLLGSYDSQDSALDVSVIGDIAYLVADGLEVLDISDRANPQLRGRFATQQTNSRCPAEGGLSLKPCRNVAAAEGIAYVADDAFGMHIVDVADPTRPHQVAGFQGLGRVGDVAVSGAYAYTAQRDRGMHALYVANPAAPAIVGTYPLTGTVDSVAAHGDYAYLGNGYPGISGLYVLSVADPAHPQRVGYTDSVGEPNHITLRGDYAYLTTGYEWDGFQIVDITNPTKPVERGAVVGPDLPAGGYDVALDGDRAYVADWGTVRLVNVANPNVPVPLGVYDPGFLSYIYSVATDGAHVYVTDAEDLDVLDWTDPLSPTVVGGLLNGLGWGQDIALGGDVAYVAADQYGLFALDISATDPSAPLHQIATPGVALDVEFVDGLVYVALGDGGLAIYGISPVASTAIPPSGGALLSPDERVAYTFPAGVFGSTVVVTHTSLLPSQVPPPDGSLVRAGLAFEVSAVYANTGAPAQPSGSYTMTVHYDPAGLGPVKEPTLALYAWNGVAWVLESTTPPNTASHALVATPDHFSYWALLGETERLYLPLIRRD